MIGGQWHGPIVPYAGYPGGRPRVPIRRYQRRPRISSRYGRRAGYGPGTMMRYAGAGGVMGNPMMGIPPMMGVHPGLPMGPGGLGYGMGMGRGGFRDDYAIAQMYEAQRLRQMMALQMGGGLGGLGGGLGPLGPLGGRRGMDDLEMQVLAAKVERLEEDMHFERRSRIRTERDMEILGGLGGLTRGIGGLDMSDDEDILDGRYRSLIDY